jgi:adenine-specific DNA-methyltransferase
VNNFILNKPEIILEPSIGRGDLVDHITKKRNNVNFDMVEIDKEIQTLPEIDKLKILYGDFLTITIDKKYKTIVSNPPYVRTKTGNLYLDFIEKCFNLLENKGEMIFIVPSDLFHLTSSKKLLNNLFLNGSFTHIYHPNNDKLFENATIDIIVFRYIQKIG